MVWTAEKSTGKWLESLPRNFSATVVHSMRVARRNLGDFVILLLFASVFSHSKETVGRSTSTVHPPRFASTNTTTSRGEAAV